MPADRVTRRECSGLGDFARNVDSNRVRLYRRPGGFAGLLRRIVLAASRNRAIVLGNHVFLPDRCQGDRAVLAHELTHCGQYQAWGPLKYYARGAKEQLRELLYRSTGIGSSPYSYRTEAGKPFESYGMEQQAQIIEDCCRGLTDPTLFHRPDPPRDGAPDADAPHARGACPPTAPGRSHRGPPPSP